MIILITAAAAALAVYSVTVLAFGNSPRERIRRRIDKLAENVELEFIHDAVINEKKKERKEKKKKQI